MKTDDRLLRAAEVAGVTLLPWQLELGTRLLAGERIVRVGGARYGMSVVRELVKQARESSGNPGSPLSAELLSPDRKNASND